MGWLERLDNLITATMSGPAREQEARYNAAMRHTSDYYAMQEDHPEYYNEAATDEWWSDLSEAQRRYINRCLPMTTLPLRAAVEHYLPGYRQVGEPKPQIIEVRLID